jgi:uncharacterized phage protein gp47/JayE
VFVRRTEDEVFQKILTQVINDTTISVMNPGGIARTLIELISKALGNTYAIFDINVNQLLVSTAGGEALDRLGALLGVSRNTVSVSYGANTSGVYFYLNDSTTHTPGVASHPSPVSITIPSGTVISSENDTNYELPNSWVTTETTTLASGQYRAYAAVEKKNIITYTSPRGTLVHHDMDTSAYDGDLGTKVLYVYNTEDLEAQSTFESDGNYRYRIVSQLQRLAAGNATALRLAALAVTGVRDAKVRPLARGIGTVDVLVIPEVAGQYNSTLSSSVTTALNSVVSAGDILTVNSSTQTQVDVSGTAIFSERVGVGTNGRLTLQIQSAITNYINSLSSGDPLIIAKLVNTAMSVSPDISNFVIRSGSGLTIGGTQVPVNDYNVGKDEQLYAGTITVVATTTAS